MDAQSLATNGNSRDERPQSAVEQPSSQSRDSNAVAPAPRSTELLRRTAILLILIFFATQFSTMTFSLLMRVADETWAVILPRVIVTACGILFSLLNLRIQSRVGRVTLRKRVWVAVGMAVAGAYFTAAVNLLLVVIFYGFDDGSFAGYLGAFALSGLDRLWFYSSLSVMILALTYAADLAESEDRVAALLSQTQAAQLKALRYQLNPHFLFNTLNSVVALINSKRSAEAEMMVESLSDFLRSTLALDAASEIPLGMEIELQSLYLDIEKVRFPDRLNVTIDVPDGLRDAMVPNLITQPLVENGIKYGVARNQGRVNLGIVAREVDGKLSLQVWDDGGDAPPPTQQNGTKVGLRNVSERLTLHFGPAATFTAGPRAGGGFSAEILMPLRRAE